jgi:hypothetical protein
MLTLGNYGRPHLARAREHTKELLARVYLG